MIEQNRKVFIFELVALAGVLLLSILGVGITDVSPIKSYYYWMALTLLFGIASVLLVWLKQKHQEEESTSLALGAQVIHWVGTVFAVIVVFALLKSGRLTYENTGLIMMLILGLSIFLDGYHMNWRFTLVGFFIMISTILVAYAEAYMWIVSLLASVVLLVILFVKKRVKHAS
jgi:hypothetical protein